MNPEHLQKKSAAYFFFLFMVSFFSVAEGTPPLPASKKSAPAEMHYCMPDGSESIYQRPKPFRFITTIPRDYLDFAKKSFRRGDLTNLCLLTAGTLALLAVDQPIIDASQQLGRDMNLKGSRGQTTLYDFKFTIGKENLDFAINGPVDINSAMYFLGDGWTHFSIAAGFWTYGLFNKDYRARQTASELTEAILTTGVATQLIKHITGRESPFTTDEPGGLWRFFPNQKDYAEHVPSHDAFPTGHLATAMATVTVIAENYPEKKFIRPLGYSLMCLLGYAMLNNGVHWISDYPLGIAMGYSFAKIAVERGRRISSTSESHAFHSARWKFSPSFAPSFSSKQFGLGVRWQLVANKKEG